MKEIMHLESLHLPTNKQKNIPASKIILLIYSLDSYFTPKTRGMSFSLLCHPSLTHPLTIPINIYINAPIFVKQLCWFCIYLLLWIHFCFLLRKCLLNIFSQILSSSTTSGFSAKDNQDSVLPNQMNTYFPLKLSHLHLWNTVFLWISSYASGCCSFFWLLNAGFPQGMVWDTLLLAPNTFCLLSNLCHLPDYTSKFQISMVI